MRAINHAVTGGIIGLTVHSPVIAVVAALVSHIVCDMIPHHGDPRLDMAGKGFAATLLVDAFLCLLLVLALYMSHNPNWLLASLCAFVATSPDLLWIREYILQRQHKAVHMTWLENTLARIQWFEKPIGSVVELAWLIGGIVLLWAIL